MMQSIEVKYGLLSGIILIGCLLTEYLLDWHIYHLDNIYLSMSFLWLIPFLAIGLAVLRKQQQENCLSIGLGMRMGMAITLLSAMMGLVFLWTFVNIIQPEIIVEMQLLESRRMMIEGAKQSMILECTKQIAKVGNISFFVSLVTLCLSGIAGVLMGGIWSLILPKSKQQLVSKKRLVKRIELSLS